jgi:hypothetical protein
MPHIGRSYEVGSATASIGYDGRVTNHGRDPMKGLRIKAALALCAGLLLVSSPAMAWVCTAKNVKGAKFTGIGLFKANAEARAITKCKLVTGLAATCVVTDCKP